MWSIIGTGLLVLGIAAVALGWDWLMGNTTGNTGRTFRRVR